jgi:hypothetical protein
VYSYRWWELHHECYSCVVTEDEESEEGTGGCWSDCEVQSEQ